MRGLLLLVALLQTPVTDAPRPGGARPDELTVPPNIVMKVLPAYIADAKRRLSGAETVLKIELIVDTAGAVKSVTTVERGASSSRIINETLLAVRKWRFEPARLSGAPVTSRVTVIVKFSNVRRGDAGHLVLRPTLTVEGADDEFEKGAFKVGDDGLTPPRERKFVEPRYTSSALARKISGTVGVDAVVAPDGTVARARISRSLDVGLDQEALRAVTKWVFEPGRKGGLPVPVLIRLEVTFRVNW